MASASINEAIHRLLRHPTYKQKPLSCLTQKRRIMLCSPQCPNDFRVTATLEKCVMGNKMYSGKSVVGVYTENIKQYRLVCHISCFALFSRNYTYAMPMHEGQNFFWKPNFCKHVFLDGNIWSILDVLDMNQQKLAQRSLGCDLIFNNPWDLSKVRQIAKYPCPSWND